MKLRAMLFLLVTSVGVAFASEPTAASKPNIVYILADDLGYGDVSILNEASKIRTPSMDRIAGEGMVFTDAHSGSAVCTPTRYGILTGRYCWRTRLKKGVLNGFSDHLIDPGRMTVASLLKKEGYNTACIGKWHLGWDWARKDGQVDFTAPVQYGPDANGFDYYYAHCGSLDMAPYVYVENGAVTSVPDRMTKGSGPGFWRQGVTGEDFIHTEVLPNFTERAVAYIREQAKTPEPFFLYLPLPAPHTPILPSEAYLGKSKTNVYGDFVMMVDGCIGEVDAAIREAGVADNTILVITSDNGCSPQANFAALKAVGHNPSYIYRGHKADIFEGGHRIPFIVRWPDRVKPGTTSDQTVCLTDLFATCADLMGAVHPEDAGEDSVSLLPALMGKAVGPLREATVHHSISGAFAIRQGKWKLACCPGSGGWSDPRPAAAQRQELPAVQLYDLESDPAEKHNLWQQHPEVVARLTQLLERYKQSGRSVPK